MILLNILCPSSINFFPEIGIFKPHLLTISIVSFADKSIHPFINVICFLTLNSDNSMPRCNSSDDSFSSILFL